jgi:hypothetical protein
VDHVENTAFCFPYVAVQKRPIFVGNFYHVIKMLVLRQDMWITVLDRILWEVPWLILLLTDFMQHLGVDGTHLRCNFLDTEFISDCSWPTGMLILQTVSPCAKHLCLSTMALQPKDSLLYTCLII